MRYFLICYIINLRRNSLCQVKETITQNSLSWMLSTIEMSIRILLKLNVPRILVLLLVHLPNRKVNFVIMSVTFSFVAQLTIIFRKFHSLPHLLSFYCKHNLIILRQSSVETQSNTLSKKE